MKVKLILRGRDRREVRNELFELSGNAIWVKGEDGPRKEKQAECKDVLYWVLGQEVELWWPVGYGKRVLYEVEVTLLDQNSQTLSTLSKRIGFHAVELVQAPLAEEDQYGKGMTFIFVVNGMRIFIGALGILVWQDFQFACGVYPTHEEFLTTVKVEAKKNVRRLRYHPALVLFCGNNKDYQQVLQWGDIPTLPALKIYESLLPAVVSALSDPEIPYHLIAATVDKGSSNIGKYNPSNIDEAIDPRLTRDHWFDKEDMKAIAMISRSPFEHGSMAHAPLKHSSSSPGHHGVTGRVTPIRQGGTVAVGDV
ncbi:glycoside hydrolase superfamily [Crucibulum laeve]|uniref:Glycoside hydrolase superfamily n=1 Tax=Crucibulum laeve TaxID=68775 RepID=A0A5C3M3Y7_9AGAR|nr:glycoside hydrolase superfamily [Crucibulum laeve]